MTNGWFHFVGSVEAGEDALCWEGNKGTYHLEELFAGFKLGFCRRAVVVPKVFADLPLAQLEFETYVPWVIDEPAPAARSR